MVMYVKMDRLILKSIWNFKWQEKGGFPKEEEQGGLAGFFRYQ